MFGCFTDARYFFYNVVEEIGLADVSGCETTYSWLEASLGGCWEENVSLDLVHFPKYIKHIKIFSVSLADLLSLVGFGLLKGSYVSEVAGFSCCTDTEDRLSFSQSGRKTIVDLVN